MRVENMTDREIVAACAVDFRRKAQEAYDAYQSTGMTRYDNAYHKYEALADALDRDVQKADTRQAAASLKSELIMLASAASPATGKPAGRQSYTKEENKNEVQQC